MLGMLAKLVPVNSYGAPCKLTPVLSYTLIKYFVAPDTADHDAARLVLAGVMLSIGQYDGLAGHGTRCSVVFPVASYPLMLFANQTEGKEPLTM